MSDTEAEQIDRVRAVGYAARILNDRAMSEDLVQEAILRVMRNRPNDETKAAPFFMKTLTRLCFDELKRRRERPVLPFVEPMVRQEPEDEVEATEQSIRIREAVDALPDRQRVVLILRFWEKQSFAEIAESMSVSESNAATLTYRAYQQLRRSLGEEV